MKSPTESIKQGMVQNIMELEAILTNRSRPESQGGVAFGAVTTLVSWRFLKCEVRVGDHGEPITNVVQFTVPGLDMHQDDWKEVLRELFEAVVWLLESMESELPPKPLQLIE